MLIPAECPELCDVPCNNNSYCDCGSRSCYCKPGFGGDNCSVDLCAAARCGEHGSCAATYLGSSSLLPVTSPDKACICEDGWSGHLCQYNPCVSLSKTCSGHGTCVANGDSDAICECEPGYSGENCEVSCYGFCQNSYPFGCNPNLQDVVLYGCNQSGGCAYKKAGEGELSSNFCVFKEAGKENHCTCESDNECEVTGPCDIFGECPQPTQQPDGTPCNSIPWGVCQNNVCTETSSTSIPSSSPSVSPIIQPPMPTPTSSECSTPSQSKLRIRVKTDTKGKEIVWLLRKRRNNGKWKTITRRKNLPSNKRTSARICLESSNCYKFVIKDKSRDGLCCGHGYGWYDIRWKGKNKIYVLLKFIVIIVSFKSTNDLIFA